MLLNLEVWEDEHSINGAGYTTYRETQWRSQDLYSGGAGRQELYLGGAGSVFFIAIILLSSCVLYNYII